MRNGRLGANEDSPDSHHDILLVEDDANDAELTLNALAAGGIAHTVEHVSDGAEALDYIACMGNFAHRYPPTQPKLILLDLALHQISGLNVLRHLKSDERTRGIPIVVLTSSKTTIERVESYKLGVNSYVIKPTDAEEFVTVVGAVSRYWLTVNEPPPR